jgi:endo-1,3(4)-beta-glucanase
MLCPTKCLALWLTSILLLQAQLAAGLPFGELFDRAVKIPGEALFRRATFKSYVIMNGKTVSLQLNRLQTAAATMNKHAQTSTTAKQNPTTTTSTMTSTTTATSKAVTSTTALAKVNPTTTVLTMIVTSTQVVTTTTTTQAQAAPTAAAQTEAEGPAAATTTATDDGSAQTTTQDPPATTDPASPQTTAPAADQQTTAQAADQQTTAQDTDQPAASSQAAAQTTAQSADTQAQTTDAPPVTTDAAAAASAAPAAATAAATTAPAVIMTDQTVDPAAATTAAVSVQTAPADPPSGSTQTGLITESDNGVFAVFSSLGTVAATANPTSAGPGSVNTVLPTNGVITIVPFPNGTIIQATLSLPATSIIGTNTVVAQTPISNDIFVPIATNAPPAYIPVKNNHPVAGVGVDGLGDAPVETNKFYTNLLVGDQTFNTYPYPYSMHWSKGTGSSGSWGFAVEHIERSQTTFGPGNPPAYYVNPLGLDSLILSAKELGGGTKLTTDTHRAFSVNVNLTPSGANTPLITFPIVQGMGFFTGIYNGGSVLIQSGLGIKQLSPATTIGATSRWLVLLSDGHEWAIWITADDSGDVGGLTLSGDGKTITGPGGFNGIVQIAKIENAGEEGTYDNYAGGYATGVNLSANADGEYSFGWSKGGDTSKTLVNWALPHHVQSFTGQTSATALNMTLNTLTAGTASAMAADVWFMQEDLPTDVGFAPWAPAGLNNVTFDSLADSAKNLIQNTAKSELGQDMNSQANLNTLYFSGKGFAKFAMVVIVAADMLKNDDLANSGLAQLENVFNNFILNKGQSTFAYDNVWKGIVDPAGYTGGDSADFGNTHYNDHMFHYGYFVYTAAVIAYLDPGWLTKNNNKDFINALVRDYSNSIENDPYFPFSRNFDWYRGHSWAGGLSPISDGKGKSYSRIVTMLTS